MWNGHAEAVRTVLEQAKNWNHGRIFLLQQLLEGYGFRTLDVSLPTPTILILFGHKERLSIQSQNEALDRFQKEGRSTEASDYRSLLFQGRN